MNVKKHLDLLGYRVKGQARPGGQARGSARMKTPATAAPQPAHQSELCPVCQKPVRIIARGGQTFQRFSDHGPHLGVLCRGSGSAVKIQSR